MRRTSAGSCCSRNDGLLSRSGETSSTSTSSRSSCASTSAHSCGVRRVDRHRPHAGALGGGDLVAHEREQRRDEHGRPGAAPAQQQRRDEVHRRLAPAGALHDERATPAVDERLDRLELPVVELGVVAADEVAERREGGDAGVGGRCGERHAPTLVGRRRQTAGSSAAAASSVAATDEPGDELPDEHRGRGRSARRRRRQDRRVGDAETLDAVDPAEPVDDRIGIR